MVPVPDGGALESAGGVVELLEAWALGTAIDVSAGAVALGAGVDAELGAPELPAAVGVLLGMPGVDATDGAFDAAGAELPGGLLDSELVVLAAADRVLLGASGSVAVPLPQETVTINNPSRLACSEIFIGRLLCRVLRAGGWRSNPAACGAGSTATEPKVGTPPSQYARNQRFTFNVLTRAGNLRPPGRSAHANVRSPRVMPN